MKEQDLVMVRLPNDIESTERQRHYNTWLRVMFIDNDGTFIGRVERVDRWEFTLYKIGEDVRLETTKIQHTFTEGEVFCYSDKITICDCPGLCRNK